MGNLMSLSGFIQDKATHNEKNLCRLFLAMRPTGPVAVAFAEIYLLLTQLGPGQTVKYYCHDVLGYNSEKYRNIFNSDERILLTGHWDAKSKDVSFLYKLLRHVCGLCLDGQNWIDPAYPLELHLNTAKNGRNTTMHSRSELSDAELKAIFQEIVNSLITAIGLAGVRAGIDVSAQVSRFISDMQSYLDYSFERKELSWYLWPIGAIYQFVGNMYAATGAIAPSAATVAAGGTASILQSVGAAAAAGLANKDQVIKAELMKCLHEAEALKFDGMCAIIRRQMNQ